MGRNRKKFVNRILAISLFTTSFFALGSILFSIRQGELSEYLASSKNQKALHVVSQIDRKSFLEAMSNIRQNCDSVSSNYLCVELAQIIIKLKNRAIDYEIFLAKTLKYSPDSPSILKINEIINSIEGISKDTFGITLSAAKELDIQSAKELADYGVKHQKLIKSEYNAILDNINGQIQSLVAIAS